MAKHLASAKERSSPPFTYLNGLPLTREKVTAELRTLLPACGVTHPLEYASHSFRIGAATSAAIAGVPEHRIRHMGRWKSDSVLRYIRVDSGEELSVSRSLAKVR